MGLAQVSLNAVGRERLVQGITFPAARIAFRQHGQENSTHGMFVFFPDGQETGLGYPRTIAALESLSQRLPSGYEPSSVIQASEWLKTRKCPCQ
jgi:hypothetical protein